MDKKNFNKTIGIITATEREAEPFIAGLFLKQAEEKPFKIYTADKKTLIISRIGKANAAMAALYLLDKYKPGRIFNIGTAGALKAGFEVGEIYHISKVAEPDRPRLSDGLTRILSPDVMSGFKTATLATQDRVMLTREQRDAASNYAELADMEGASVIQACKLYKTECYLFKIVSDTLEHEDTAAIQKNIKWASGEMFAFFRANALCGEDLSVK